MRITEEQMRILDGLSCHRLSSDEGHKVLVRSFMNALNPNLVKCLQSYAWDEDYAGSTAYYLVKDVAGQPLFFFSLKCGALYQHFDADALKETKKKNEKLIRLIAAPQNKEEVELAAAVVQMAAAKNGVTPEQFKQILVDKLEFKNKVLYNLTADINKEAHRHINRVSNTHSGIELVHFCKNDQARDIWNKLALPQKLGQTIYWHIILPIIKKVREVVGCSYLFLFAADSTEDGLLINYYTQDLKLNRPDNIGTNKPIYDFSCVFMCNEISELLRHQEDFYDNFNPDVDADELV